MNDRVKKVRGFEDRELGFATAGSRDVWLIANCQLLIAPKGTMATTAKIAKTNKKPKFSTQHRNRCSICGRPRGFLRKFGLCRLCFRGLALKGEIPGVSKSSW